MAHGTPDWGVTAGAQTIFQLTDLGELAARLGSPITHDRRGDVIWWDDFEWSLNKWSTSLFGTGAAVALSTARARNGQTSALLTGGSDGGRAAQLTHYSPFVTLGRLGGEISFSLGGTIDEVGVILYVYTGSQLQQYQVEWDDATNTWRYLSAPATFTALTPTRDLLAVASLFHTMKLVIDAEAGEYVRLLADDITFDLSGASGVVSANAAAPAVAISPYINSRGGSNDTVYMDDAILTQNEPA